VVERPVTKPGGPWGVLRGGGAGHQLVSSFRELHLAPECLCAPPLPPLPLPPPSTPPLIGGPTCCCCLSVANGTQHAVTVQRALSWCVGGIYAIRRVRGHCCRLILGSWRGFACIKGTAGSDNVDQLSTSRTPCGSTGSY
jgi:hypothetical protein